MDRGQAFQPGDLNRNPIRRKECNAAEKPSHRSRNVTKLKEISKMLRRRIMIVDDHPLFRNGLRRVLEQDPRLQVVAEASNGHDALHEADVNKPALVIMDVQLP